MTETVAKHLHVVEPSQKLKPLRFVTAASLFDGHDVSINVMRRILQSLGAEVIHLAHNRSVNEVVTAAIQEDADAIAISSYQGGHVEYFKYMIDLLKDSGCAHIQVFGGGGGVIVPDEIETLHQYGISKIYSPEDGQQMGLKGMIQDMLDKARTARQAKPKISNKKFTNEKHVELARLITAIEEHTVSEKDLADIQAQAKQNTTTPVIGITGTGGAGKSSLTDELIRCFHQDKPELNIALIALDPSKRKSGGALLGDRIRMNALNERVYMRSMATRHAGKEISDCLPDVVASCKATGFELIIVETSGIGQGDAAIVPHVDVPLYVMTPEFGAASQLEKIDMLDFAQWVAINKFDRKGAEDALRDVRKQIQRNQEAFDLPVEQMPVFGTIASQFNDAGVIALYLSILQYINEKYELNWHSHYPTLDTKTSLRRNGIIPANRNRYLAEISETVRNYHSRVLEQVNTARKLHQLNSVKQLIEKESAESLTMNRLIKEAKTVLSAESQALLDDWDTMQVAYHADEYVVKVRDKELRTKTFYESLSGTKIPKVCLPQFEDHGEQLKWLMKENVPGKFPYTAGVFPFKRESEDPTRMFAGEGDAYKTNERFKLLSKDSDAARLSTAFDSVTLYGFDPAERPDIYGKVGNSGVSIATLDDMKVLYDGFDLCAPSTSVSMTINGPAPTILAMFLNTAIDQQIDKFQRANGRLPNDDEHETLKSSALQQVRGTVQADILKEDQGQNTCIFSTDFSLKMMGDIQAYFIQNQVRNFYSVSISGYHIAEAGANPISQLAFTLANAFTYVEAYLARGMAIDDFAPNFSFFFSNGMDPEYSVMGRVARRVWAVTLRDKYHANARSQKLKYHVQTSGRSLHAQEMHFNDIRTTLEGLIAIYDNCNSLHTNAYDEAITTPTDESVRRALAIQLIINREWGLAKNENPNQGAFIIDELTDLVEEAVLQEFERINDRGGVLGAMETGYQRGKIQDESMHYEIKKHDGSLPIIGVNTFLSSDSEQEQLLPELRRSTEEEKQRQIARLKDFQEFNQEQSDVMLRQLQEAAEKDENVFAVLMEAVRYCSLGQITEAFFEVGGKYRRNM